MMKSVEQELIRRRALGPQLVVNEGTVRRDVHLVANNPEVLAKPHSGLWSSTYDPAYGSAWVQWCVAYRYNDPFELTWTLYSLSSGCAVACDRASACRRSQPAKVSAPPRSCSYRRCPERPHRSCPGDPQCSGSGH